MRFLLIPVVGDMAKHFSNHVFHPGKGNSEKQNPGKKQQNNKILMSNYQDAAI